MKNKKHFLKENYDRLFTEGEFGNYPGNDADELVRLANELYGQSYYDDINDLLADNPGLVEVMTTWLEKNLANVSDMDM